MQGATTARMPKSFGVEPLREKPLATLNYSPENSWVGNPSSPTDQTVTNRQFEIIFTKLEQIRNVNKANMARLSPILVQDLLGMPRETIEQEKPATLLSASLNDVINQLNIIYDDLDELNRSIGI